MLILTRKAGQGFTIGDDVEITITEISGEKVRVGINAPKHIKVLRSELSETVAQNQQAAGPASSDALKALAQGLKADISSALLNKTDQKSDNGTKPESPTKEKDD